MYMTPKIIESGEIDLDRFPSNAESCDGKQVQQIEGGR
jgi:hypothetical protein